MLIVDDEESIRVSIEYLLKKEKYNVSTAKDSLTALEKLKNNSYEVVLTDIVLEDDENSGVELLKKIKQKYSQTLVLLMTGYASLDTAIKAVRLGASDYLIKPCTKETILSSIKEALNKKSKDNQLNKFDARKIKIKPGEKPLTQKELEVFEFLFRGLKLDEIANKLHVSVATIKFHLKNLYKKLGIKGRREIISIYQ